MTFPTIHRNGTSANELLRQTFDASDALRTAIEALQQASPNGRDYYQQGGAAFTSAVREHTARVERLRDVLSDLERMAEHVSANSE
jgi:ABC-type transporter Mla subunit MlaD